MIIKNKQYFFDHNEVHFEKKMSKNSKFNKFRNKLQFIILIKNTIIVIISILLVQNTVSIIIFISIKSTITIIIIIKKTIIVIIIIGRILYSISIRVSITPECCSWTNHQQKQEKDGSY